MAKLLLVTVCPFLRFCQGIIAAQCMPVGNQAVIAVHGLAGNDLHNGLNGEFFSVGETSAIFSVGIP